MGGGGGGGGVDWMISVKIIQWCLRLIRVYAIYILVWSFTFGCMVFSFGIGLFIWVWSLFGHSFFIWVYIAFSFG